MATAVGITVPKMLPITGTWSLPIALYGYLLSGRVSATRLEKKQMLGTGDDNQTATEDTAEYDSLLVAYRSHANFSENVPLALIMAAIVELNGGSRKVLNSSLAALLVFRIIHVELGLRGPGANSLGRLIGHLGTASFVMGMAGYSMYLVKGYWGF